MSAININLTANTSQYTKRLKEAKTETDRNIIKMEQRIDSFASQVATDFSSIDGALTAVLNGMRSFAGGGAVAGVVTGIGLIGAAAANAAYQQSLLVRELNNMSRVSGMSVTEYQAMAFAAKQYGLQVDQLASASKDALEKIGDYLNTGGGGFQDFADAMGMSKQATVEWAETMKNKSGIEVLQRMYTEMEKAGLSTNEISHALEGMGSDLTYLAPLLANNGKELTRLTDKFKSVTSELSPAKTKVYTDLAENMDALGGAFQTFVNNALLPAAEVFGDVALAAAEFLGSMNAITVSSVQEEIDALTASTKSYEAAIKNLEGGRDWFGTNKEVIAKHREEIEKNNKELDELKQKLKELKELENKPTKVTPDKPKGTGSTGSTSSDGEDTPDPKPTPKAWQKMDALKAGVMAASDPLGLASAQHALRLEEINQMSADAVTKQALIDKANQTKLEAERQYQRDLLAIKVEAAVTEQQRLEAENELALTSLLHRFDKEKIGIEDQNAMKFNLAYEHEQEQNALNAEKIANEDERKIAEAEANLEFLRTNLTNKQLTQAEFDALALEHQMAIVEAKRSIQTKELDMTAQMFGALGGMMKEGSKAQRAMLVAEKAATISKLGMQMWDAWGAVDDDPTLITQGAKFAAKAGVLAQYGGAIAQVTSTTIGQAHSGMDEIDQTGSYILKAGERVIQPTANKDLTAYLKDNNSSSKQAVEIKSDLVIQGDTTISDEKFQAMLGQHRESLASFVRLAQRENPSL